MPTTRPVATTPTRTHAHARRLLLATGLTLTAGAAIALLAPSAHAQDRTPWPTTDILAHAHRGAVCARWHHRHPWPAPLPPS
jgi:hypothetical protein